MVGRCGYGEGVQGEGRGLTSRWSRPPNQESSCCQSWLCVVSLVAGWVGKPGGGSAPIHYAT